MKFAWISAVLVCLASFTNVDAGFGKRDHCCPAPSCCAPAPTCAAPAPCCAPAAPTCCAPAAPVCCAPAAPACCAPAPTCCDTGCCGKQKKSRRNWFAGFRNRMGKKNRGCGNYDNCCHTAPTCCAPAAPSCCAPAACAPTCAAPAASCCH